MKSDSYMTYLFNKTCLSLIKLWKLKSKKLLINIKNKIIYDKIMNKKDEINR